jgi:hypothetical protein
MNVRTFRSDDQLSQEPRTGHRDSATLAHLGVKEERNDGKRA